MMAGTYHSVPFNSAAFFLFATFISTTWAQSEPAQPAHTFATAQPANATAQNVTVFIETAPLDVCARIPLANRQACVDYYNKDHCIDLGCCWDQDPPSTDSPQCYYNPDQPKPIFHDPPNKGRYEYFADLPISPLHLSVVPKTGKVVFLERLDGGTWGSTHTTEFDIETKTSRDLHVKTDIFCSAGMVLPEASGRLINVGGWSGPALQGVRFYTPSGAPRVQGTTDWMEDYTGYSLRVPRWYPTTLPLPNGKLAVIGGQVEGGGNAGNNQPNVEVLPVEEGDGIYELQVLKDTDGANTYPNAHVLPSGNVLIVAGNKAAVHDWKNLWMPVKNMPDMTHGNRTFPYTGQSILLPLYPPDYKTEVVVCGGGTALDPMAPALSTCISIEPEAENPQWVTERMPSPRTMPDITILPDGTYLITNGAEKGHGGFNAANSPSFNAYLYDPRKPHHERFSILNTTTIARMYHSEGTLLTDGRVLISGSAPYVFSWVNLPYPTEYRMEVYHPPYLTSGLERPVITQAPREEWPIYGEKGITMMARIPSNDPLNVKVNLIIDGFVTHSTHMGQRLVGLEITVMKVLNGAENNNEFKITMIAPPNANIAPPGWYMLFVLDGPTPSEAAWVWVGGDPANFAAYPGNVSSSWVQ